MATRFFTRSILTTKQTLSSVLSRSYTSLSLSTPPSSLSFLSTSSILRLRPLVAVAAHFHCLSPAATTIRGYATRQTSSSLNDPNPNWSNRPPKETILLEGKHEEEARMKIYSVSTRYYYAFGALVSEELSYKLKDLPSVRWVLPDSYLDVRNKDYGGEPFINGQAVPYDPKYHEEWVRNNARANDRNRRNDRPRNFDRSRNFERRRENMQNRDFQTANRDVQNPGSNMGGQPNMGGMPPNNMGGAPNMGGMRPNSMGQMPPNNMGGGPPNNMGGVPPNMGGMSPNNMGGVPNNAPNSQYGGGPNNGGMPYQNREMSGPGQNREYQHSYAPNTPGGNPYQNQNMPGRDMPPPPNYQ